MRDYVGKAELDGGSRAEVEQGLRELADPTIEPIPHEQIVAEWEAEKADLLARMAPPSVSGEHRLAARGQTQPAQPDCQIAEPNPAAALAAANAIHSAIEQFSEHPRMGLTGRVAGTRELAVARMSFIVIYVVQADTVQVVRVPHAGQPWPGAH